MPTIELPPDIYNRLIRLSNARPYPATTVDQEVELAAEVHLTTWEAFYFGELPHRPAYHAIETIETTTQGTAFCGSPTGGPQSGAPRNGTPPLANRS